jgi:hypothetical protein
MTVIEQDKLIAIMNALGYHADPNGVCLGLCSMAEQALLAGELKKFFDRITFIIKNSAIVIQELGTKKTDQLTTEQKVDIRGFLDGILINHVYYPNETAYYFIPGIMNLLSMQYSRLGSKLVEPTRLKAGIKTQALSTFIYKEQIAELLACIKTHFGSERFAVSMGARAHATTVLYDPNETTSTLMDFDPNAMSLQQESLSIEHVSHQIFQRWRETIFTISIRVIDNPGFNDQIKQLMADPRWKAIHDMSHHFSILCEDVRIHTSWHEESIIMYRELYQALFEQAYMFSDYHTCQLICDYVTQKGASFVHTLEKQVRFCAVLFKKGLMPNQLFDYAIRKKARAAISGQQAKDEILLSVSGQKIEDEYLLSVIEEHFSGKNYRSYIQAAGTDLEALILENRSALSDKLARYFPESLPVHLLTGTLKFNLDALEDVPKMMWSDESYLMASYQQDVKILRYFNKDLVVYLIRSKKLDFEQAYPGIKEIMDAELLKVALEEKATKPTFVKGVLTDFFSDPKHTDELLTMLRDGVIRIDDVPQKFRCQAPYPYVVAAYEFDPQQIQDIDVYVELALCFLIEEKTISAKKLGEIKYNMSFMESTFKASNWVFHTDTFEVSKVLEKLLNADDARQYYAIIEDTNFIQVIITSKAEKTALLSFLKDQWVVDPDSSVSPHDSPFVKAYFSAILSKLKEQNDHEDADYVFKLLKVICQTTTKYVTHKTTIRSSQVNSLIHLLNTLSMEPLCTEKRIQAALKHALDLYKALSLEKPNCCKDLTLCVLSSCDELCERLGSTHVSSQTMFKPGDDGPVKILEQLEQKLLAIQTLPAPPI